MQALFGFVVPDAGGNSFPKIDVTVCGIFRPRGLAQHQSPAWAQGAARLVQNPFLFFGGPIMQHVKQQDRVAGRIFPIQQVLPLKADARVLGCRALGHPDFVIVVIHA